MLCIRRLRQGFRNTQASDTQANSGLHDELQISRGASALNPNTAEHHLSLQRMSFMTAGSRVLDMQLTKLLGRLNDGDRQVMDMVIPLVYQELKKLARARLRSELNISPLQTTALVHEAFLRLSGSRHPSYENRSHFYGIASRLMRQVLVDTARAKAAEKRSAAQEVPLADLPDRGLEPDRSVLALEDALQWLEKTDELKGQLIEMRYFGGMTAEECSTTLSVPVHIVRRELRLAQVWLRRQMAQENPVTGTVPLHQEIHSPVQIAS
jgi:RNA polymerase sigma factor (TIGR02999 family)